MAVSREGEGGSGARVAICKETVTVFMETEAVSPERETIATEKETVSGRTEAGTFVGAAIEVPVLSS